MSYRKNKQRQNDTHKAVYDDNMASELLKIYDNLHYSVKFVLIWGACSKMFFYIYIDFTIRIL